MADIPLFHGASRSALDKLNRMVEEINRVGKLRGSNFIVLTQTAGGLTVSLDINAVIERIPKNPGGGGTDFVGWYLIISTSEVSPNVFLYLMQKQRGGIVGKMIDVEPGSGDSSGANRLFAYNSVEIDNAATGLQGNGADLTNYPMGTHIRPLSGRRRVYSQEVCDADGIPTGELQYWIEGDNGMPEDCNSDGGG